MPDFIAVNGLQNLKAAQMKKPGGESAAANMLRAYMLKSEQVRLLKEKDRLRSRLTQITARMEEIEESLTAIFNTCANSIASASPQGIITK